MTAMQGRVALITGASSGVGLACARRMAAAGARVVLGARRADRLQAFAADHPGTLILAGDLAEAETVDALFDLALCEAGRIDIVVNNAGAMTSGAIEDIDLTKLAAMVRLNVEAAFRVMYLAVRHFRRENAGHLFNITSTVTLRPTLGVGAYAGTKHAVAALAHALRMELGGSNIRMTNISPGLIETELHRDYPEPMAKTRGIARPLSPEEVVDAILYAYGQPAHVRIADIVLAPGEAGQ
jgi:NADP-dependent 3-hydroxy acid dehydrogenase YdfG